MMIDCVLQTLFFSRSDVVRSVWIVFENYMMFIHVVHVGALSICHVHVSHLLYIVCISVCHAASLANKCIHYVVRNIVEKYNPLRTVRHGLLYKLRPTSATCNLGLRGCTNVTDRRCLDISLFRCKESEIHEVTVLSGVFGGAMVRPPPPP